jgi:hypothetical protein
LLSALAAYNAYSRMEQRVQVRNGLWFPEQLQM